EEALHALGIELSLDHPGCEQGSELRREEEPSVALGDVEWLNPEPIAGEEDAFPSRIEDRERKHPPKTGDDLFTQACVGPEDHLGVGRRDPIERAQLLADGREIVNLTVEHDHGAGPRILHRLSPRLAEIRTE